MADQPITLDDVKRLDVHPGDTVVLRCDTHLYPEALDQIDQAFAEKYGDTVKVLVLDGGLRLDGIISGLPEPERKTA